jgi:hypothetical protein
MHMYIYRFPSTETSTGPWLIPAIYVAETSFYNLYKYDIILLLLLSNFSTPGGESIDHVRNVTI